MKYVITCGNLTWNGYQWTNGGRAQLFDSFVDAGIARDAVADSYPDAVVEVDEVPRRDIHLFR